MRHPSKVGYFKCRGRTEPQPRPRMPKNIVEVEEFERQQSRLGGQLHPDVLDRCNLIRRAHEALMRQQS